MTKGPQIWHAWVDSLSRWGLSDWVAVVLETAGPLNILAAQVVYLVQPLLTSGAGRSSLDALAHLLEDTAETQAFVNMLREATHLEPGT